jgi:hypothetical protein
VNVMNISDGRSAHALNCNLPESHAGAQDEFEDVTGSFVRPGKSLISSRAACEQGLTQSHGTSGSTLHPERKRLI